MPKSRTHAKRRAKLAPKKRKKGNNRAVAKQAQAEEPKEKYSIDDLARRT